jgi:hypothetical protein
LLQKLHDIYETPLGSSLIVQQAQNVDAVKQGIEKDSDSKTTPSNEMVKKQSFKNIIDMSAEAKEVIECPRCGFEMKNMTVCHMRCNNCGAELTCSDKSFYW